MHARHLTNAPRPIRQPAARIRAARPSRRRPERVSGVLDTEVDIAPWRSIRELMAAIVADLQNNLDRGWR
jgi:hypothetical protein